jgi:hypothetical protein
MKDDLMNDNHFKYFLILDKDLKSTLRYVELDKRNYKTFSLEYVRLILSICAEVEVICKKISSNINPDVDYSGYDLPQMADIILQKYPKITDLEISVPLISESILPFESWEKNHKGADGSDQRNMPSWWSDYNHIKHARDKNYPRANLENALFSLSGLFGVLLYWYRIKLDGNDAIGIPESPSILYFEHGGESKPVGFATGKIVLPDFPASSKKSAGGYQLS